jgi:hypothetical protein
LWPGGTVQCSSCKAEGTCVRPGCHTNCGQHTREAAALFLQPTPFHVHSTANACRLRPSCPARAPAPTAPTACMLC